MNVYLSAYNIASMASWSYVLYELVPVFGSVHAYSRVGSLVTYVQSAAVLEILHAALGFVRTPLATTVMQVFSRLLLVWGICFNFDQVTTSPAFSSMVLAWSITEVTRYSYYGLNLAGLNPRWLLWCRYTFFYALYPIGAVSEWILMFKSLDHARLVDVRLYYAIVSILVLYIPGFYVMYSHMITQRRKYLGSTPKSSAKSSKRPKKSKKIN